MTPITDSNQTIERLERELAESREEVRRLREALEFYAADDSYIVKYDTDCTCDYTDVERDGGEIAAQAIAPKVGDE